MSLALTGRDLVTRALKTIGVLGTGESPSAADAADAFDLLNELVDAWAIQALTVLTVDRQVYALVSGQGGPDNPYTYGPGGDWDTGTAARPPLIQQANLLLNTSTPAVRIPLPILTTAMFSATQVPALENPLPTTLYYNDTVPTGTVVLWPIPTAAVNEIELFVPLVMPGFATLDTLYVCPPGYAKAFRLGLADSCVTFFGVGGEIAAKIRQDATQALLDVKVSNVEMADLSLDPGFTPDLHGSYVIQTDTGA